MSSNEDAFHNIPSGNDPGDFILIKYKGWTDKAIDLTISRNNRILEICSTNRYAWVEHTKAWLKNPISSQWAPNNPSSNNPSSNIKGGKGGVSDIHMEAFIAFTKQENEDLELLKIMVKVRRDIRWQERAIMFKERREKIKDKVNLTDKQKTEAMYLSIDEWEQRYGRSEEHKKLRADPRTNPSQVDRKREAMKKEFQNRIEYPKSSKFKIFQANHIVLTEEVFVEARMAGYEYLWNNSELLLLKVKEQNHRYPVKHWKFEEEDLTLTVRVYRDTFEPRPNAWIEGGFSQEFTGGWVWESSIGRPIILID